LAARDLTVTPGQDIVAAVQLAFLPLPCPSAFSGRNWACPSSSTTKADPSRSTFESLKAENLQIVGVSRDTPASQKKFQQKYNLPFSLVADADGKVAEAFGVGGVMGLPVSKRQSFLIKNGLVVWISLSAKTGEHAAEVQAALDSLK
jgi:peroxiredoxin Q/BCP